MIKGTYFISNVELIAITDIGATHSFISLECAMGLGLKLSSMVGSMVIDTPTNGSVTIALVCLSCPFTIYGKNFAMDLVVYLCIKSILFLEQTGSSSNMFISTAITKP